MDAATTERIGSPSLGDVVRQGDLYLVCVESLPDGRPWKGRQLAPGTTQGSRHVAEGECRIVDGNDTDAPRELLGPSFECLGDVEVSHPEHGNKILPEGTCWSVVHQRTWADEVRRVQD